jgi:hypothetical protein
MAQIHALSQHQSQDESGQTAFYTAVDGIVRPLYRYFRDPETVVEYHVHHQLDAPAIVQPQAAQAAPRVRPPPGERRGGRRPRRLPAPPQDDTQAGPSGSAQSDHDVTGCPSPTQDDSQAGPSTSPQLQIPSTGYATPPAATPQDARQADPSTSAPLHLPSTGYATPPVATPAPYTDDEVDDLQDDDVDDDSQEDVGMDGAEDPPLGRGLRHRRRRVCGTGSHLL